MAICGGAMPDTGTPAAFLLTEARQHDHDGDHDGKIGRLMKKQAGRLLTVF